MMKARNNKIANVAGSGCRLGLIESLKSLIIHKIKHDSKGENIIEIHAENLVLF